MEPGAGTSFETETLGSGFGSGTITEIDSRKTRNLNSHCNDHTEELTCDERCEHGSLSRIVNYDGYLEAVVNRDAQTTFNDRSCHDKSEVTETCVRDVVSVVPPCDLLRIFE